MLYIEHKKDLVTECNLSGGHLKENLISPLRLV